MATEEHAGVVLDRCTGCGGMWFDATELDRLLSEALPDGDPPDEADIPDRGLSGRRCPRCDLALRTAGWTDAVLDRCATCRGLFVGERELGVVAQMPDPGDGLTAERLRSFADAAGWGLLSLQSIALILMRLLRR
jgi:Zn-finger nucleic acid-binding protein